MIETATYCNGFDWFSAVHGMTPLDPSFLPFTDIIFSVFRLKAICLEAGQYFSPHGK